MWGTHKAETSTPSLPVVTAVKEPQPHVVKKEKEVPPAPEKDIVTFLQEISQDIKKSMPSVPLTVTEKIDNYLNQLHTHEHHNKPK
jgi:spore cortex formation protein SpoVR/YcgB (stage V sporulation)